MGTNKFSDDFKRDAVAQITERGYPVAEISKRLGVSTHSLYAWKKKISRSPDPVEGNRAAEIRRLKQELARVTEERDILKKETAYFAKDAPLEDANIVCRAMSEVRIRCRASTRCFRCERCAAACASIHPSGFYAWLKNPLSKRAREDVRQTELLSQAWKESGKVYGYRKLHDDLLDQDETCCLNRVARLTRLAGIKAEIGYRRRPGNYGGKPSLVIDNTLDRRFDVAAPTGSG